MRNYIPLVVLLLIISIGVATADEFVPMVAMEPVIMAPAYTSSIEVIAPVTSIVENRYQLTREDLDYLATVPTIDGLRERVRQLMVAGIHHRPASGRWQSGDGTRIDTMYQTWTGPYQARIRIPLPPPCQLRLPPLGELRIVPTEPIRLCPVNVTLRPVERVVAPCAPAPCQPPGSMVIGRAGSSQEHTVGGIFFSHERERVREEKPEEICPPDQHAPFEPAPEAPQEESLPPEPCI